jgi:hypothetical protein
VRTLVVLLILATAASADERPRRLAPGTVVKADSPTIRFVIAPELLRPEVAAAAPFAPATGTRDTPARSAERASTSSPRGTPMGAINTFVPVVAPRGGIADCPT